MSDLENNTDRELSFKERILRDLEMLKQQVEEADDNLSHPKTPEVSEDNPLRARVGEVFSKQEKPEHIPTVDPSAEDGFMAVNVERPESAQPYLVDEDGNPVSETDLPTAAEAETVQAPPVPDFVERQARALEKEYQKEAKRLTRAELEREGQQTHKVELSFKPEVDPEEEFIETEKVVAPMPKRAVDAIEEDLSKKANRSAAPTQSRRRRSEDHPRPKKKSKAKKVISTIFTLFFLAIVATAVAGYFFVTSSLAPIDAQATEVVQVQIPEGASVKQIGQTLEKEGLIKNATIFDLYAKVKNYSGFQSGYHNLQKSMDVEAIIEALQKEGTAESSKPSLGKITIPEGYTLKQISEAIAVNAASTNGEKSPFTAEEFLALVSDEAFISEMQTKYPDLLGGLPTADTGVINRLEGYLFPATYEYENDTTVREVVEDMLAAMDANLRPYYEQIAANGQTVNQILTLASLVEKEGSLDEDRKNIASVFYNRLQWNMPLQSNIAILYAEGKLGEKITLAEDASINTQIDSPYNVYTNLGYMPGPVVSPSLSAIKATIEPNTTDYFYFVADVVTGKVYFANTLEEHDVNVQTYVNAQIEAANAE